jgi:hypothetical protein
LCAEFDCETFTWQAQAHDGRRKTLRVVVRKEIGINQRRAVFEETEGPIPEWVAESILNRLGVPLRAFGFDTVPPPPRGSVN